MKWRMWAANRLLRLASALVLDGSGKRTLTLITRPTDVILNIGQSLSEGRLLVLADIVMSPTDAVEWLDRTKAKLLLVFPEAQR